MNADNPSLLEEYQRELELDAVERGRRRFRRRLERRGTLGTGLGREMLLGEFAALTDGIRTEQEALSSSAIRPKPPRHWLLLLALDAEKLAVITLQCLLDVTATLSVTEGPTLKTLADAIGRRCRRERVYDQRMDRAQNVEQRIAGRNKSAHARRRSRALAARVDEDAYWAEHDRQLRLGMALIGLAIEKGTIFRVSQVVRSRGGRKTTPRIVQLTDEAATKFRSRAQHFSLLSPVHCPMVVLPQAWTAIRGGGYLESVDLELVKRRGSDLHLRLLEEAELRTVLRAVNALQATGWQINRWVYRHLRLALREAWQVKGLPKQFRRLPPSLPDGASEADRRARNLERKLAYDHNRQVRGQLNLHRARISTCHRFWDQECFYFPYQLDFRGRAYAVPPILNPQVDDAGRALLQFAVGKPLDRHGRRWLAIHLSNTFGLRRLSFQEREQWVERHDARICDTSDDPRAHRDWWCSADKPWSFLAACHEWAALKTAGRTHLSRLPVFLDGTCNGIQHLSALGRDEIGAAATNLLPNDRPNDLYEDVAGLVSRHITVEARRGVQEALEWMGHVNREVTKGPTLATPYGITLDGIRSQLLGARSRHLTDHLTNRLQGAQYMARVLADCIAESLSGAMKIQDWLQAVAEAMVEQDRPVVWTAPSGFPVLHEYIRKRARRIRMADFTVELYEEDDPRRIDRIQQRTAIAANFVHSMDAAHMVLTLNALSDAGLCHVAAVHDSFAVHASDCEHLGAVLRQQFVALHKEPLLELLVEDLMRQNPGLKRSDLPLVPEPGELDLSSVLEAEYAFS